MITQHRIALQFFAFANGVVEVAMMQFDVFGSRLPVGEQVHFAGFHFFGVGNILPHRLLRRDDKAFAIKLERGLVSANDVIDWRVIRHGRNQRHRGPARVIQEHVESVGNFGDAVAEVPLASGTHNVFGKAEPHGLEDAGDTVDEQVSGDATRNSPNSGATGNSGAGPTDAWVPAPARRPSRG